MIKHIVMWKFKEGEHDNMLIFRDRLLALKGQIPEIRAMEVGINMNPSDRSFDAVLVSEFDSLEALKAYSTNPLHVEVSKFCKSIRRGVALWDVLAECSIDGASDSSIKNAVPNRLDTIFQHADIRAVFTTGKKAQALYERFFPDSMKAVCLPSTSPANRTISEAEMLEKYRQISDYLP